eukprot:TRINITY_DN3234_c0_g1_i1.p1 TRINITY_DN3234_c0_g1~~TRINITY_DN3234_c0_g1_i1.p1  ORF type:complete len:110 (+),score=18.69 TRINITY_DN3234_c0_g1_i1:242-571(+)
MLTDFSQENRRKFIRFAWAQDRLPADDDEFQRSHTRLLIKPPAKHYSNPDIALPRADTCFFNIELPRYSTRDIMELKFLFAINQTVTMNADEENMDDDQQNNPDYSEEE